MMKLLNSDTIVKIIDTLYLVFITWYVELVACILLVLLYTNMPLPIRGELFKGYHGLSSLYAHFRRITGGTVAKRAPVSLLPFFKQRNNPLSQKKVFVAYFGTVKRGVNYTLESHKRHIFEPLMQRGYAVDIIAFSLYQEDGILDGQPVFNESFTDLLPVKYFEEAAQSEADAVAKNFRKTYCKRPLCNFFPPREKTLKNAFRQWFSEQRLADMIEQIKSEYDFGIVIGPDFYVLNTLDLNNIDRIISQSDAVAVSDDCKTGCIPNGFYVAKPENLVKILSTYRSLSEIISRAYNLDKEFDYEYSVESNANLSKLALFTVPFYFTKIRNNAGYNRLPLAFKGMIQRPKALQEEILHNADYMLRIYPELFYQIMRFW